MNIATVCIPVAPAHLAFVNAAISSAQAQTIPVEVNVFLDADGLGAGYARNAAAANVDTPFLTFLDADDTLEPTFIEHCLEAYTRGHYVYTGWNYIGGESVIPPAENPFDLKNHFHLVTTLIPTAAFRAVGGFDESLPGHEDADLYFKLMGAGICGTLVPEYLVNYSPHGIRGNAFHERADYEAIKQSVYERNGGDKLMSCCGRAGQPVVGNPGAKQEGDVLAIALWSGIKDVAGSGGSRRYRGGNFSPLWVAPRDIEEQPHMFRKTFTTEDLSPDKEDVLKASGLI